MFQQPEFIEENRKQTRALVDIGNHLFQQPEFIEENRKRTSERMRDLVARGEQARHETLQQKKEQKEHAWQRKKEQEEQASKAQGKYKTFDDRMELLKRFKETHGHANVTSREDIPLGQFCTKARHAHKNPGKRVKLTDKCITAFDAMDFNWTPQEYITRSFNKKIEDLEKYGTM